ncbi:MAG: DNA polymerase III subunit delta [Chloroflexota bacterium]|nr:DNA polymerase III subunit delta [Chloroflexota bacterium]
MLYLFCGADELARTEALHTVKAAIPADLADLNVTILDGRKLKLEPFAAACEAFPFLADRRLVIVEDALKGIKSNELRDAIKAYLPRVPDTTDLVFVEREEIDKRSALYTYLKKAAAIREFLPKEGVELQRWLQERARQLEVKLASEAGVLLAEFVGNDSRALLNELQKLASYVGVQGMITLDAVRLMVADEGESSVFAFVDALAARQLGPALALLRSLLADGEAPLKLLFMIGRQVRLLLQVKACADQRMRPDAIAAELKQPPFVVRKAVDQAGRFSATALVQLHDRLLELDHWSKTGRIDDETALELLVAETCATQPQRSIPGIRR